MKCLLVWYPCLGLCCLPVGVKVKVRYNQRFKLLKQLKRDCTIRCVKGQLNKFFQSDKQSLKLTTVNYHCLTLHLQVKERVVDVAKYIVLSDDKWYIMNTSGKRYFAAWAPQLWSSFLSHFLQYCFLNWWFLLECNYFVLFYTFTFLICIYFYYLILPWSTWLNHNTAKYSLVWLLFHNTEHNCLVVKLWSFQGKFEAVSLWSLT